MSQAVQKTKGLIVFLGTLQITGIALFVTAILDHKYGYDIFLPSVWALIALSGFITVAKFFLLATEQYGINRFIVRLFGAMLGAVMIMISVIVLQGG
ncbi:MAG: hypothetical protein PHI53_01295 [Candidatus Pacebacteria bacterium]|nr:hypothetical protein [Candidatus Paceibacterota bacterium]